MKTQDFRDQDCKPTSSSLSRSWIQSLLESILDWATARNYRTGENLARWRGHLQKLLPACASVAPVQHHKVLPYAELPAFMTQLRSQAGVAAR